MSNSFFDHPILNSPYDHPARYWELDENGTHPAQLKYKMLADMACNGITAGINQ